MPDEVQLPMLPLDICYCHRIVRRELTPDLILKIHMKYLELSNPNDVMTEMQRIEIGKRRNETHSH